MCYHDVFFFNVVVITSWVMVLKHMSGVETGVRHISGDKYAKMFNYLFTYFEQLQMSNILNKFYRFYLTLGETSNAASWHCFEFHHTCWHVLFHSCCDQVFFLFICLLNHAIFLLSSLYGCVKISAATLTVPLAYPVCLVVGRSKRWVMFLWQQVKIF